MKGQEDIISEEEAEFSALCPWCRKGETLADTTADIRVSCCCSCCGRFYRIDFRTMRVIQINPKRRRKYQVKFKNN